MDDMKISGGSVPLTNGNVDPQKRANNETTTPPTSFIQQEGITISNHLSKLMGLVSAGESIPDDSSRVMDMKRKIQANEYSIDFNALSDKLISSGALRA